jgi:NAD(P)-dependent dehydrogenase (short-subunit alcohol dehydrogenase family)
MEREESRPGTVALIVGATGSIGGALNTSLCCSDAFSEILAVSRPALDVTSEESVAALAEKIANMSQELSLVIDATGYLHDANAMPEKSWRQIDPEHLVKAFRINAIGPAILMKHFLPLMPRDRRSVFATLSARVGSIGDNKLGGWYGYRASKAALNQFVRTAAVELKRKKPLAICVALHPGTVESKLSAPFAKSNLEVRSAAEAADQLLKVIDELEPRHSGGFFDHRGDTIPW